jgi:hypothetical protein
LSKSINNIKLKYHMETRKAFKIIEFGDIKISTIGNRYRHVMLKNLHNNLSLKFNIYEEEHSILWRGIEKKLL